MLYLQTSSNETNELEGDGLGFGDKIALGKRSKWH